MKTWSFYRLADGHFTGRRLVSTDKRTLAPNIPEGCGVLEGNYNHLVQRVDLTTGEVIEDISLGAQRDQERRRDATLQQIAALEQKQLRPLRELVRDPANATARLKIDEIDIAIAKLREDLT